MKKIAYLFIIAAAMLSAINMFFLSEAPASSGEAKKKEAEGPAYFPLSPFMVNIHSAKGVKMLRTTINIEISNAALLNKAKDKTACLRDAIILVLTSKYAEELFSPVGKLICKDDIINRANQILGDNAVKDVYFTDFLLQ